MEIFRTDGGGRTENEPRLVKVIGNVMNLINSNDFIWKQILSVEDNKGHLFITFQKPLTDTFAELYLLTLFMKEWDNAGESPWDVNVKYLEGKP